MTRPNSFLVQVLMQVIMPRAKKQSGYTRLVCDLSIINNILLLHIHLAVNSHFTSCTLLEVSFKSGCDIPGYEAYKRRLAYSVTVVISTIKKLYH